MATVCGGCVSDGRSSGCVPGSPLGSGTGRSDANHCGTNGFQKQEYLWRHRVFQLRNILGERCSCVDYRTTGQYHDRPESLGWAFGAYLTFTLYMTIGAAAINKVLFVICVLIDLLFIALVLHVFSGLTLFVPGLINFVLGLMSFYASAGVVLNTHTGRRVLPMGSPLITWAKDSRELQELEHEVTPQREGVTQ